MINWFDYFTDPILRGPTIACMLMCLAASLVGVVVVLRKQSLIGEALTHASYPGVICGVIVAGFFSVDSYSGIMLPLLIISGAFITSILGMYTIGVLQVRLGISSDASLCFVLSSFFGVGIALASQVQFTYSSLYQQIQVYLYGQAATMTDVHIRVYALLALLVIIMFVLFYKEIQLLAFDQHYAKSLGFSVKSINALFLGLTVLAVVIGIRSVGVVLMSAMLIAPPVAARQFTNKLYILLILSAVIGMLSGFIGNVLSVEGSIYFSARLPNARFSLPTGPMIVLVASFMCLLSLLFAPNRGLMLRALRVARFRYRCCRENVLKVIWRRNENHQMSFVEIREQFQLSYLYLMLILYRLVHHGWLQKGGEGHFRLTHEGVVRAAKIVRLHRLWEVYLSDYLGVGAERVHRSAEEMEHIITPELEKELTELLKDPKMDPHHQPIPPMKEL